MTEAPRTVEELRARIRHELRWSIRLGKAALVLALFHVMITLIEWLIR